MIYIAYLVCIVRKCADKFQLPTYIPNTTLDSEERAFQSSYITYESGINVYYSYSTCNSTAEDWFDYTADDFR